MMPGGRVSGVLFPPTREGFQSSEEHHRHQESALWNTFKVPQIIGIKE